MEPHIDNLLTICESDLKDPRSDKRAVRRTRALLEQAKYISRSHYQNSPPTSAVGPANSLNVPQPVGMSHMGACTCTIVKGQIAAKDKDCPVHP
jgi:hypothetical protein